MEVSWEMEAYLASWYLESRIVRKALTLLGRGFKRESRFCVSYYREGLILLDREFNKEGAVF